MDAERGLVPKTVGETKYLEKSPFVQGFIAGVKGALLGGAGGAAVQVFRGKSPLLGALIGGLGAGIASGLSKGVSQDVENISTEEAMRYHMERMKSREPFIFMPPPPTLAQVFSRYHQRAHGIPDAD
jgi:hypothetical protein